MIKNNPKIIDAVRTLLEVIEGEPLRQGISETPDRVMRAYDEMFDGYDVDIGKLLSKTFQENGSDQIVSMRDIEFWSTCEHHILPFHGYAHIAYLPTNKVLGASKLERLVMAYAHRLQLQERITRQVADALMQYLQPLGVAVIIHGEHLCMRCRGVKSSSSQIVTSVMLGEFRTNQAMRMEVLSLLGLNNGTKN